MDLKLHLNSTEMMHVSLCFQLPALRAPTLRMMGAFYVPQDSINIRQEASLASSVLWGKLLSLLELSKLSTVRDPLKLYSTFSVTS